MHTYRDGVSQRLTMFVGVVPLRYQHMCCVVLITEWHNSHKHSQSPFLLQRVGALT